MKEAFIRGVSLDRASRKKDRSVAITFITDTEQSTKEFSELDELLGSGGFIYYKSGGTITNEEMKQLSAAKTEKGGKSKSQRLRGALYGLYTATQDLDCMVNKTFEDFYSLKMEQMIAQVKGLIEAVK